MHTTASAGGLRRWRRADLAAHSSGGLPPPDHQSEVFAMNPMKKRLPNRPPPPFCGPPARLAACSPRRCSPFRLPAAAPALLAAPASVSAASTAAAPVRIGRRRDADRRALQLVTHPSLTRSARHHQGAGERRPRQGADASKSTTKNAETTSPRLTRSAAVCRRKGDVIVAIATPAARARPRRPPHRHPGHLHAVTDPVAAGGQRRIAPTSAHRHLGRNSGRRDL